MRLIDADKLLDELDKVSSKLILDADDDGVGSVFDDRFSLYKVGNIIDEQPTVSLNCPCSLVTQKKCECKLGEMFNELDE